MLAKYKVSDIRKRFAIFIDDNAIDDREFDIRVVIRHLLHDRSLSKSDPNDQVEASLGKSAHRGFDRGWISRLDIVQANVHVFLRTLHTFPCRGIKRPIVLAADIKHDTDLDIAALAFG